MAQGSAMAQSKNPQSDSDFAPLPLCVLAFFLVRPEAIPDADPCDARREHLQDGSESPSPRRDFAVFAWKLLKRSR